MDIGQLANFQGKSGIWDMGLQYGTGILNMGLGTRIWDFELGYGIRDLDMGYGTETWGHKEFQR